MEVKIMKRLDGNNVLVESNLGSIVAKWKGDYSEIGQNLQVEIDINDKFTLNKNMYIINEFVEERSIRAQMKGLFVNIIKIFDDNIIAVKLDHNEDVFLLEVDNPTGFIVNMRVFLETKNIELWNI